MKGGYRKKVQEKVEESNDDVQLNHHEKRQVSPANWVSTINGRQICDPIIIVKYFGYSRGAVAGAIAIIVLAFIFLVSVPLALGIYMLKKRRTLGAALAGRPDPTKHVELDERDAPSEVPLDNPSEVPSETPSDTPRKDNSTVQLD